MVSQIYLSELQLNKANTSETVPSILDLHLYISYGIGSTKIYDKRDDFDFKIVHFPFSRLYILWSLYFSTVADFNTRNKLLTQKLP